MLEEHDERLQGTLGKVTWIWYFIGLILFVPFVILVNYQANNTSQFNSTLIFVVFFFLSIALMFIMPRKHIDHLYGPDEMGEFWMENPTWNRLILFPIGLFSVIGESYVAAIYQQPFIGLIIGGFIMMVIMFETRSVVISIWIHGVFNVFVLVIQAGWLGNSLVPLATTGVNLIPLIGNPIPSIAPIFTEIGFQLFLVSTTEECLKVAMTAGFIVMLRGTYNENSEFKWAGGSLSVIIWASLHYIVSLH